MSGEVIVGLVAVVVGLYGGVWATGYNADRDRDFRRRDAVLALLADLTRIQSYLGIPGGASFLSGLPIDRPKAPTVHRWVEHLIVTLAAEHPALMGQYMNLDARLANVDTAAMRYHEAKAREEEAWAAVSELEEAKVSNPEATVRFAVPDLVTPAEELGLTDDWSEAVREIWADIRFMDDAVAKAGEWTRIKEVHRALLRGADEQVRRSIAEIELALRPLAAREPRPQLPFPRTGELTSQRWS